MWNLKRMEVGSLEIKRFRNLEVWILGSIKSLDFIEV
jgi:hypothetical protein